ncbi:MAG: GNAT family N-acetyltransferase [Candidatus Cloacimonetes bacterium]|nr:GNAT family N-acetyltransferase [Candidatus Cloacimonadota bacterium]
MDFSELTIKKMKISDYDALIKLWNEAGLPYRPKGRDRKEKITKELENPNAIFLVAVFREEIIGSIFGTHDGRKGWINRLAISPPHRKLGLAQKMIEEVEKKLTELGIEIIACMIEDWNNSSMKLFEKVGYIRHPDIFYFTKRYNPDV